MCVRPNGYLPGALIAATLLCAVPRLAVAATDVVQPSATGGEQARAVRNAAGTLVVTAVDTLEGRLPGATVTVSGPDGEGAEAQLLVTDASGEVRLDGLPAGAYVITVELPGFAPARIDARVEPGGTSRHEATLAIQAFAEEVAVTEEAARYQETDGFSESLTAEDISQLPDDPDQMVQLLDELAGGEAEFRVNGFEGGELPPKDQIQAIRIRQDPFAPDSMGAGRPRVEVITRPGSNAWKHEVNAGLRDQSLDARQAFAPERGEGQTRRVSWSLNGPLVKDRTSLAARFSTRDSFDAQTIVATGPSGPLNDVVNTERGRVDAEVRVEHALNQAHTLRLEYQHRNFTGDNLGVGDFDLRERAYADERQRQVFRMSETGTFGTKLFNEFRLEYVDDRQTTESVSNAVALNVQNAFVAGGAQRMGGQRNREIEIANSLEFAPNDRHKLRVGFEGEFGHWRSDRVDNAAGTFTFASLADYEAERPRQFVQRVGDPRVGFSRHEFSWWVHDDVQLGQQVRIGVGLRHDFQGYLDDRWNLAPRLSVAWTPGQDGRTTVNAGFGVFNEWLSDGVYEQSVRLDGTRQRDLIVSDPSFPHPFEELAAAELPPPSVVRLADDLFMQRSRRVSVGVEHRATDRVRVRVSAFGQFTRDRMRAVNVNAPVSGVVPDPAFGRVTEVRSVGRARSHGLDASVRASSSDRRTDAFVRYRWSRSFNDADGPLSLPADADDLGAEWGAASSDVPHRIFGRVRMDLPLGFRASVFASLSSGRPYTITTGFDDNADTVFNDRPADVGRNSERGAWQRNVNLRLGWQPLGAASGGGEGRSGRGGRRGGEGRGGATARGLEIYAHVSNLFNETNYTRYAGVLTSPFFGQPIAASSPRRLEFGTRVFF